MSFFLLDDSIPWFGKHTGFSLLQINLAQLGCRVQTIRNRSGFAVRAVGKVYSKCLRVPPRNQLLAAAELEFRLKLKLTGGSGQILFLDGHLDMLQTSRHQERWVGMIHQPRRIWAEEQLKKLRIAKRLMVLCDRFVEDFGDCVPASEIAVVPYGVDTTFFSPNDAALADSAEPHLLYVGAWLRNTQMLRRLMPRILAAVPHVIFDFVVPAHARKDPALAALTGHHSIRWHQDLSDFELRHLYQKATAMFIPMEDSGANSAILEALASGLPIVTTDIGGIRSYGGGNCFPVVANNDDDACLDLLLSYLQDSSLRASIGAASRRFAVEHLEWAKVAKTYLQAYRRFGLV